MRIRMHVSGSRPSHKTIEENPSVCRRGCSAVEADGLLLEGSALVRGKRGYDGVCQAKNFGTG